jgi:hypothetical protein
MDDVGHHTLTFRWLNPATRAMVADEANVAPGPNPSFEMDCRSSL